MTYLTHLILNIFYSIYSVLCSILPSKPVNKGVKAMENKESTRKRNSNLAAKAKDITDETWLQIEKDIANLSEKEFYNKWECSPSGINKYLLQWKAKKEVEGQFKDKLTQKDQKIDNLKSEIESLKNEKRDLTRRIEILEQEKEKLQQSIDQKRKSDPSMLTYKLDTKNNVRTSFYVNKEVLAEWREKSKNLELSQTMLLTTCMKHFMDHHWPKGTSAILVPDDYIAEE